MEDSNQPMSQKELEKLAYVLQIPYDPLNFDTNYILNEIDLLREKSRILADKKAQLEWEEKVRESRIDSRTKTPCHEPVTLITNKDTSLMSNEQLVFMPDKFPDGHIVYFCFDKHEDVPVLLESGINPFTSKKITPEQRSFLEGSIKDDPYPNIPVNSYFDEIQERFGLQSNLYTEKEYKKKMDELVAMVEDVGLLYEAGEVLNFATNLSKGQYNLFLLHKPINQKIEGEISRDRAAAAALNFIVNYINIQKLRGVDEGNKAIVQIGKAIDEFMYMVKNNIDYDKLIEERGVVDQGQVKELFWKPKFLVEEYYLTGEIKNRYYIDENGKYNGSYIQFYKNGNTKVKFSYEHGILNGIVPDYYPSGELLREVLYINDRVNGTIKLWHINGKLQAETTISGSEGSLMWDVWDDSGNFMGEKIFRTDDVGFCFVDEQGVKDGYIENKHYNAEYEYIGFYKKGLKHGYWQFWYDNQDLKEKGYYLDDQKVGEWVEIKKLGRHILTSSGSYHQDKKTGVWETFDNRGMLRSRGVYENDIKIGEWIEPYSVTGDKTLLFKGVYEDGKREGEWVIFDDKITGGGMYIKGSREGTWKIYDGDHLIDEIHYDGGEMHGLRTRWYGNGQKMSQGSYENGSEIGLWKKWYENGQPKSEGHYILHPEDVDISVKDGTWTEWDEYGNRSQGSYALDERIGTWNTWDVNGNLITTESY